ncbi:MAG: extracellular solute-binding protein [Opitutaceae bacterium]
MKPGAEKTLNFIGLFFIAGLFTVALFRVFSRSELAGDERTVIRFTHWQIESGVREAFDRLEEEYEKMHPDVDIVQIPIPGRIFVAWRKTQLIGGDPPDLLQLGNAGLDITDLARFYEPLGDYLTEPNPYNKGTDLEGVPWRQTFIDGLQRLPNYYPELLDVYGIPTSSHTFRVFFNRELLATITGSDDVPTSFQQWVDICRQVEVYNRSAAKPIYPIVMGDNNARFLLSRIVAAQTQLLSDRINPMQDYVMDKNSIAITYLTGAWSLESPAIPSALGAFREIGRYAKPGFLRLDRADAMFEFIQGRSLFLLTGSWDYQSVVDRSTFGVGAFPIPLPEPSHPLYGRFLKGNLTEIHTAPGSSLGLTKASKHPEIAMDFMRYVTSKEGNALFCRISGWLPATIDVDPGETVRDFLPVTEGYPGGFTLEQLGAETMRVLLQHLHQLLRASGSVDDFVRSAESDYTGAVRAEFEKIQKNSRESVFLQDAMLIARLQRDPDRTDVKIRTEVGSLIEGQTWQEGDYLWGNLSRTRFQK